MIFLPRPIRILAYVVIAVMLATYADAQSNSLSISLNPATAPGVILLDVNLSATGDAPVAIEWNINFPGGAVGNLVPVTGPAAPNKSIRCSINHCVIYGLDNAPLQNGVVAVLTFQIASGAAALVPFSLNSGLGASPAADANAVNASGLISFIKQPLEFSSNISAGLSFVGSFPQVASAQDWDTAINLVNTGTADANARLLYFGQDGNFLRLPMGFPQAAVPSSAFAGTSLDQTLAPNAALVVNSTGPDARPLQVGSARLFTNSSVGGFIRYRYHALQQEASVPLETRWLSSLTLAFDNTNGTQTGIALTNLAGLPAVVPVTVRDDSGTVLSSSTLLLAVNGQTNFLLSSQFPEALNRSGTVKFDPPVTGPVSVMGLRFPPSMHFSTIPVISDADPNKGSFAHLAVNGGWTTTIELINHGNLTPLAQLNFYDESGNPLPLQITLPQTGQSSVTSKLTQRMMPFSRLVVLCTGQDSAALQTGSATFTSPDGPVSGFIRHHFTPMDQESLLPLESRNSQAYLVPFDNTNGLVTGIALANTTGAGVDVGVVIRDGSGTQIGADSISLVAHGHTSFVLSDRIASAGNQAGVVEFNTPSGGQISVMGVRLNGLTFSAIPTLAR